MDPGTDSDEEPPPRLSRGGTGRTITAGDAVSTSSSSSGVQSPAHPPPAPKRPAAKPVKKKKKASPAASKSHKRPLPAGAAPPAKRKRKAKPAAPAPPPANAGSSGDEYTSDLLANYIGQTGACAALGLAAYDVLNVAVWRSFSDEERDSLRVHLPSGLARRESDAVAERVLGGEALHFGSARDRVFDDVVAGLTHPRVRRWRQRVSLVERRHHVAGLKEYHNGSVRRLAALKAPREAADDVLAHLAITGGGISKPGDSLLSVPERIESTALAAARSPTNEWDVVRWRRVLKFRNEETERYNNPERAYEYHNPWGRSVVAPLRRGPALDGGRPREHDLLRNERPSHVTILCLVRDAASRMPYNRGTRGDICDLLRDSQFLREGATFAQLNTVVSGALDRLHYEKPNAPVVYDAEAKEWCYLHNGLDVEDFEIPEWAAAGDERTTGTRGTEDGGKKKGKKKKKKATKGL